MEQQMQTGGIKGPIQEHAGKNSKSQNRYSYYWFTVVAKNGQVLVTSETYKTKRAMRNGIRSLIKSLSSV